MNELQIFNNPEFGEIRTIEENGMVLFCGSDVARALGYAIPSKAVNTPLQRGIQNGNPYERRHSRNAFHSRRRRLSPYHAQQTP